MNLSADEAPSREINNPDGKYGEKFEYEPDFRGPVHQRSCTNVPCLVIFIVVIVAWISIGCLALVNGDPNKILHPRDSSGQRCGLDDDVKNKPYLMYFDLSKCVLNSSLHSTSDCPTTKVCVSECPKKYFTFSTLKRYNDTINDLYCTHGTKEKLLSMESIKNAVNSDECAAWYVPSQRVGKRCLPVSKINSTLLMRAEIDEEEIRGVHDAMSDVIHITEKIIATLEEKWQWIVAFMCITEVVCIIYTILMQLLPTFMVWLSLLTGHGLMAVCMYYACVMLVKEFSGYEWLFGICGFVILFLLLLLLLYLRKRIKLAVGFIREASRAVAALKSTTAFATLPGVLQCIIFAWTLVVTIYLMSCGEKIYRCDGNENKSGDICDPSNPPPNCGNCTETSFKYEEYVIYLLCANVLGSLWGMLFVSGLLDMILAGAFATWYWTFKKDDVTNSATSLSIYRTVRYHLGTVALGSLILSSCTYSKSTLENINETSQQIASDTVTASVMCSKCSLWCLQTSVKLVTTNIYIVCAVHGTNFWHSGKTAFNLMMRNILRILVLEEVTSYLLSFGILTVTFGMMVLSYYVVVDENERSDVYGLIPVILIGIGSFHVAFVWFRVFKMAVDTLFLCFLEDLERNDGSPQKPYFMSKELLLVLRKQNTRN